MAGKGGARPGAGRKKLNDKDVLSIVSYCSKLIN